MSYAITNYLGSNHTTNWDLAPVVPVSKPNESITTKIVNFLFPKNELTGRRTFKVIPSFLVNAEGRLNYELYCPFYKVSKDPELNELVKSVFDRLVRQIKKDCPSTKSLSWEVRITKDPTFNACCFPGGKIEITTGCIETLKGCINHEISHEDLLATILAHEMVHAVAEHQSLEKHLNLLIKPIEVAIIYGILSLANPIPALQLFIRKGFLLCLNRLQEITNKCFHKCLCEWFGKYNWLGKCLKMYNIKHLACFHKELSKYLGKYLEKCGNIYLGGCGMGKLLRDFSYSIMKGNFYIFLYFRIDFLFFRGRSRSNELEADRHGIFLMHAAGFNLLAFLAAKEMSMARNGEKNEPKSLLEKAEELTRTHPCFQIRFQEGKKIIEEILAREQIFCNKDMIS